MEGRPTPSESKEEDESPAPRPAVAVKTEPSSAPVKEEPQSADGTGQSSAEKGERIKKKREVRHNRQSQVSKAFGGNKYVLCFFRHKR